MIEVFKYDFMHEKQLRQGKYGQAFLEQSKNLHSLTTTVMNVNIDPSSEEQVTRSESFNYKK